MRWKVNGVVTNGERPRTSTNDCPAVHYQLNQW